MANGKVSVNSDIVANMLTYLNDSYLMLDEEVTTNVDNNFQALKELNLDTNCLDTIKLQVKSITELDKQIIDLIAAHLASIIDTNKNLGREFTSAYTDNTYVGNSQGNNEGIDIVIDAEEDGKKINADNFTQILDSLDDQEKKSLLTLLNMNKEKDISLNDLLMNYKYSEKLFTLLKTIFGESVEFDNLSSEEIELIQKIFLDSIVKDETEYEELETDSILMSKEYLANICKEYKIEPRDLIFNDMYGNVLKISLKNLYNGNVEQEITDTEILNFRKYIDKVSLENNMNSYQLMEEHIELLL